MTRVAYALSAKAAARSHDYHVG